MNWHEASQLIKENIIKESDVNTDKSTYRIVEEVPPYQCKKYNYVGEGYKVRIGEINTIEIPLSMLEAAFHLSVENKRIYNTKIFTELYPKQRKDHPCHVHTVGKIFELSGVATAVGSNYHINK